MGAGVISGNANERDRGRRSVHFGFAHPVVFGVHGSQSRRDHGVDTQRQTPDPF